MLCNEKKICDDICDVLVVGGGTSGVIAAIQAARAGAKTVLSEISTQLGGTMTTGGVNTPAYFFVGDRQIVSGIGWELVRECVELDGGTMPDYNDHSNSMPSYHVHINPNLYVLLAEEKCIDSGVKIRYQESLQSLSRKGSYWHAEFVANMLTRSIKAKEIIDCTGDATAIRLAGGKCYRDNPGQPGTLSFILNGYKYEDINFSDLYKAYHNALKDDELQPGDCFSDTKLESFLRNKGRNMQHIFNADSSDSELYTEANIASRKSLMRILRFLKKQPALENISIINMQTAIAIRDSWRIVAEKKITSEDYLSGKMHDDAIAWTYYFIDIHHEKGVEIKFIPEGVFPTIPMKSLIPKGMSYILSAGRTISSDRSAFSALRVQASCMAMGQAVGAAAALGVKLKVPSREVPLDKLKSILKKHGALVPQNIKENIKL